jgi:hypothetical protein
MAQGRCRQYEGPRVVSATVAFDPSGAVRSVAIHHAHAPPHSTVACVRRVLRGAQIQPYAGGVERISVSVALD